LGDWIKVKNRKHPAAKERVMEILKPRQAQGRSRRGLGRRERESPPSKRRARFDGEGFTRNRRS
jgi:hypothetical protein